MVKIVVNVYRDNMLMYAPMHVVLQNNSFILQKNERNGPVLN